MGQRYLLQQRRPDSKITQTDAKTIYMEAIYFLSFHLIFNVRASVNCLRGSQQSPVSLFS